MPYYLAVTTGPDEGKSCEVDGGSCLIGRSDAAELKLEDESISWEHARVVEEGGKVFLENLSALGTSVKGQKISGRYRLQPNDEIELSNRCKVKIEIRVTGVTKSSSS
ncbi:MAG: FHA domain-containing protein, partial [Planctomycetota bacterium]